MKQSDNHPGPLRYQPVRCNRSGSILNPHCAVDYQSKTWTCPFSGTRNRFPAHYAEHMSEQNLPAELLPRFTTVEYELPGRDSGPPVFLFVVDTCFKEKEELDELKDSLQQVTAASPVPAFGNVCAFDVVVVARVTAAKTLLCFPLPQGLSLLPEEALVGLITFGKMVHVHEVRFTSLVA